MRGDALRRRTDGKPVARSGTRRASETRSPPPPPSNRYEESDCDDAGGVPHERQHRLCDMESISCAIGFVNGGRAGTVWISGGGGCMETGMAFMVRLDVAVALAAAAAAAMAAVAALPATAATGDSAAETPVHGGSGGGVSGRSSDNYTTAAV